jgi:hypothetical protein
VKINSLLSISFCAFAMVFMGGAGEGCNPPAKPVPQADEHDHTGHAHVHGPDCKHGHDKKKPQHVHNHDTSKCMPGDMNDGSHYHEGNLLVSRTRTIPHDLQKVVFEVKSDTTTNPSVTIFYRVGERGNLDKQERLTTKWESTNQYELKAEDLKGKLIQFALKESEFGKLDAFKWTFLTDTKDHFGDKFVSREDWCARAPREGIDEWSQDWHTFVVTHTAGAAESNIGIVRRVQNFHMDDKKWSDIGYHYLIGVDGKIYEGRSLQYQGATIFGHNKYTVGLAAMGCFDSSACDNKVDPAVGNAAQVTDAMIQSFGELLGFLSFQEGHKTVDSDHVKAWKDLGKGVPPGDRMMARMNDIVTIANQELKKLQRGSSPF